MQYQAPNHGMLQVDTCLRDPSYSMHRTLKISPTYLDNPFRTPEPSSCGSSEILDDPESFLLPDPGTEDDFRVDNNPFAFSPGQLNKLTNPKSLMALRAMGGLRGIEKGLQTDVKAGLSADETCAPGRVSFQQAVQKNTTAASTTMAPPSSRTGDAFVDRSRVYTRNILPAKKATPWWKLMWNAYNDQVLILLTVAAFISLALGLYEALGMYHPPGSPTPINWVEGLAICIAILVVTVVTMLNDFQKERAFVKLSARNDERQVNVVRSAKVMSISVHNVLVGDLLRLEAGDVVPADGLFIDGQDLKCDESSATGESDAIRKTSADQVMAALESGESVKDLDPFIISGTKVLEGIGTYLCTSVGIHSSFGKTMMAVRTETEATPLQVKLEGLALAIGKIGGSAAALLFFVLLFRFVGNLPDDPRSSADKASSFMDILIVAVTIIVVAVPEGLPLAVTLALAFATTKMLKQNNLVRVLRACETMGNATTICSDKTGTLTANKMTVVAGAFGDSAFSRAETGESLSTQSLVSWVSSLKPGARSTILQSVVINSTAFESAQNGETTLVGSKTEIALLQFAKQHLGLQSVEEVRANEEVVQMMPFDPIQKCMAVVVKRRGAGYRLLVKGAAEILLGRSSCKVSSEDLVVHDMASTDREVLQETINAYARQSLRTIALAYKDFGHWPPSTPADTADDKVDIKAEVQGLTLLGIVGIQDPLRPGVAAAVRMAQSAGVVVRMVTGDNALTARAIAEECGIYTTGGLVMEGSQFRALSDADMDSILPRLQVLARSSPEDKRILVCRLKALGETVAATGDGTNDALALKAADVGFSMGEAGTEVAKEASAIVLMDDNFASIITALKWGRAVNDSVQKFLQFQITVNITAVILAFVTAIYDPQMKSVLKAVQLLWINLIMDTFAALALATDPPTDKILDRPPQAKKSSLITPTMWKMIIGQAIFQLAVTFTLYFAGPEILGYDRSDSTKMLELDTIIFNTFVWMQIFNEFNSRRLDNQFNIFEGVHRNHFFIVINCLMVGLQVAIIFIGSRAFQIKPGGLDGIQWAISVVVALFCLPWAVAVRLFPDAWLLAVSAVIGKPFLVVYGLARHLIRPVIRFISRKKAAFTSDEESEAPEILISPAPPTVIAEMKAL